jgi:ATP-binding cassette subfamily B protein
MDQNNAWKRLYEFTDGYRKKLLLSIVSATIGCLCGILPYLCAGKIITGLIHKNQDNREYVILVVVGLAGYIAKTLLYQMALSKSHFATFHILRDIRKMIIDKLPRLPLGTIINTSSGKIKQIIVDQVESMETSLAHLLPEMTANVITPISILVYLFVLDWRMALLSIVSIPVGMMFMMTIMKSYAKDYEGSVKVNQRMNNIIVEYIRGIEVIKAFNQGERSYQKYEESILDNAGYFYGWMKKAQWYSSISKAFSPTTMITILPIGWIFYLQGSLEIDRFLLIILLSLAVAGPILAAMDFIDSIAKVGTIVNTVDELLKGKEQIHGSIEIEAFKENKYFGRTIKLKDVSFGYEEDKRIIEGINLTIKSGTLTALVGPSGSGKSTIAKLIAGFWDVETGSITMEGIDLRELPLQQLYDQVAFVAQDNFLFDETVLENIRMGNPQATIKEVVTIAKEAGCHDFIMQLEHGYETKVGGGGHHLSGGERQRIAIARAMLKKAPIIVLDEATAYMDPENEEIVQVAVSKLIKDKTVIVVAHRLSTIVDADAIVVVNNGRIDSLGRHEELLIHSSLYQDMWKKHMGTMEGENS